MDPLPAEQKVAIVTGASRGIGAALVTAYRGLGYAVVATARSVGESDDPQVFNMSGDITEPGVGARVVDAAVSRYGRIDTVVNNAGLFISRPFTDYTDGDYEAVVGVHLRGFFDISRRALSVMTEQRSGGHLITISASLAETADSRVRAALTSLTKGGLNAATKALAIEYAVRGVRVNAVALGAIRTTMHSPESHDALAGLHPLGRLGEIGDVVDAVTYLENAPFVTGEILHVDGGQSAGH
jgi:NAD(P)-dependent dehydrogenase (short-subunit alcohol dehydrogenase family)